MKKSFLVFTLLFAVIFTPFIIPNNNGVSVQARLEDPDCDTCQHNRRQAIVACLRLGGTYENGEPSGWITVGDRMKCKSSQDDNCPGETACAPTAN